MKLLEFHQVLSVTISNHVEIYVKGEKVIIKNILFLANNTREICVDYLKFAHRKVVPSLLWVLKK